MKYIFYLPVFCIAVMAFACRTTGKSTDTTTSQTIHQNWMLKTIDSVDDALVLKSKAFINLSDTTAAIAKAGCNNLRFGVKLSENNGITFTQGIATKMYCAEFMPAENGLTAALKKIKSYTVAAHKIWFKDADGKTLIIGVAENGD